MHIKMYSKAYKASWNKNGRSSSKRHRFSSASNENTAKYLIYNGFGTDTIEPILIAHKEC